jgi:uncharacterized surface protein with fasciclin (FAS1) repeats
MSSTRRTAATLALATLGAASAFAFAPSAAASGTSKSLGTTSLAEVLAADGAAFDHNWYDYDVVDAAVTAVLTAKPDSPVKVLADGTTPVTAFLPSDLAFQRLVADLTGSAPATEGEAFAATASLGIDTVEAVLLYHVVPGATITSGQALRADGAELATALPGATFEVDVRSKHPVSVRLIDADPDDGNAYLVRHKLDINRGNKQIAHGISQVLRPANL